MQHTLTRAPGGWPSDLPSPPPHPHPSLLNKVAAHLAGVPTTMFCHPDALAAGLALSARAAPPGPLRARLAAEHARRTAVAGEIRAAAERRRERNLLKRSSMAEVECTGAWRPRVSLGAARDGRRAKGGSSGCLGLSAPLSCLLLLTHCFGHPGAPFFLGSGSTRHGTWQASTSKRDGLTKIW